MTEWLMVTDCKSVGNNTYVGSNPTFFKIFKTYSLMVKHIAHNGQNKGSTPFKSIFLRRIV